MATAVTVIFGANSTQFQAELKRMTAMATAAATKMSSGVGGVGAHGPRGMTGVIRETTVIGREIAMGRGLGRVLGSMTLLVQYLKSYVSGADKAASYTEQLAAGYQRLALQANVAAIAAMKKAEASAADAFATNLEDKETIAAADADAAKAASAQAAAVAAQEKAVAATEAAEAEQLEAAADGEVTAASLPLMAIFFGLIAVLALLYGAYKVVTAIIRSHTAAQIEAQKVAYSLKLTFGEEADAIEKLRKEAEKTDDALAKLGESHDKTAKHVQDSIAAWDSYYEAHKKATDLMKEGALTKIDIAEKTGSISKSEAINERANVETLALKRQSDIEEQQLRNKRDALASAAEKAAKDADKKAKEAKDAELTNNPEAIAKAKEIERLRKIENDNRKEADEVVAKANEMKPGKERNTQVNRAGVLNTIADMAQKQRIDAERALKPDELAASEKMRAATEAREAANTLEEEHKSAASAYGSFERQNPAILAGEQRNIELKRQLEQIDALSIGKGYEMNSAQKVGAYSAAPPEFKQMVNYLQQIASYTQYMKPQPAAAPTQKGPQFGTRPNH